MWTSMAEFIITCLLIGVCYAIQKGTQNECGTQDRSRRRSRQVRSYTRRESTSRASKPVQRSYAEPKDPSSSPLGYKCLNCDAVFEDEIDLQCPRCGSPRQRCPLCQRFVARGQDLLACPSCKTLGHANELESWVWQKKKCPHCGAKMEARMLIRKTRLEKVQSNY